jgi:dUTP pyrophosphatase
VMTLYNTVQSIKKRLDSLTEEVKKMRISIEVPYVVSNKLLFHKHKSDAGFDLESIEDVIVPAKDFTPMIHTGVHVSIPQGFFGLVKERSGMAAKGISVLGGVIDSGYTGEIMVNLQNMSGYDYVIKSGDRIAQLIIIPCSAVMIEGNPEEIKSERGENGFGSTGR